MDVTLIHWTCVQYTPTIITTVLRADLGPKPCDCLWLRLFPLPRPGLMFVTSANCNKRLRCCRNSGSSLRFILAGASGILLFQHPAISTKKVPIIFHSKKSDAWKCILLAVYSIEFSHDCHYSLWEARKFTESSDRKGIAGTKGLKQCINLLWYLWSDRG